MSNKMINSNNAPKAIGPYSHSVRTGDLLYISGQIPVVPATGEVAGDTFKSQTEQSMKNILAILEEVGLNFDNVVKTNIFITDMSKFSDVNEVYSTFFKDYFPARACVQVSALPKNVLVEIEAVASFN
ncbi:RidA family protein [Sedimentibacter sp. zth1]|uniref:RidA family protein n=1 Tax=Sedimentibacter sp. zth1 TaxID=2816908 RepID=UPI001A93463F|nr:RidA family protein [Sedimentibacter sp. zth1]QSX04712.1 RidA family protein [Sedimentibacter sp. zth1]